MGFGLNQVNNQEKQNHSGLGEPGCDRLGGGALGNGIGGGLGNGICSGIGAGAGGGSTGVHFPWVVTLDQGFARSLSKV